MPYVSMLTNVEITKEKEDALVKALGEGIEVIKNKTKENLFIKIEDKCKLYKGGDIKEPNAMLSVDLFGYSDKADLKEYCNVINETLLNELGIKPDKIFINFTECRHWGSRGNCNTAYEI